MTCGSYALLGSVVGRDVGVVSKLRSSGAIILEKASLSEWAHIRSFAAPNGWSARGGRGSISGVTFEEMKLQMKLGVPYIPQQSLDIEMVKSFIPYGKILNIEDIDGFAGEMLETGPQCAKTALPHLRLLVVLVCRFTTYAHKRCFLRLRQDILLEIPR